MEMFLLSNEKLFALIQRGHKIGARMKLSPDRLPFTARYSGERAFVGRQAEVLDMWQRYCCGCNCHLCCSACSDCEVAPCKPFAMTTHYEALGITRGASTEQIKRAHRSLAKVWHPDTCLGGSEAAAEAGRRIREINAAYTVLSNARTRASYDATLEATAHHQERQLGRHSEPIPEHCSRCKKPTTYWERAGAKTVRLCHACGGTR